MRPPFQHLFNLSDIPKESQSGQKGATEILGMNRSTFYNRMKKLGMLSTAIG
ncbi:MAG: hypothetical protein JSW26_21460 [Desulfobacterales bacterium]|nr:MAG: hypothetical protein JSW26_21460 [Desulfobacterales bacterium]